MKNMKNKSLLLWIVMSLILLAGFIGVPRTQSALEPSAQRFANSYDVRSFGAKGDGQTLDTPAINKAIEAAASAGGGTVHFPAGTYLCFSIRMKSNIALYLDQGATILAADPKTHKGTYDLPEPNEWDMYEDFGHSHWQNSLIWGIGLENISILGPGRIDGKGLTRRSPRPRRPLQAGDTPASLGGAQPAAAVQSPLGEADDPIVMNGLGNKAISLKLCRNVVLRDFSILNGGHFALLATGVDNLTIDNLKVDTNRDGFDIDACRNVRISNCSVNAPNDDAIVLKSSYGLGFTRATENVTITNCLVSGYDIGSLLDATYKRNVKEAPDHDGPTGRLKFGTESNGGFKNITITNIVFDNCRGLALETVDGGLLEDVTITNITMRDIKNSPIFLRLGSRLRGPKGVSIGELRRVNISEVVVYNADPRYASIISGIPGHEIEDVRLSNIRIYYQGGGTRAQSELQPPEREANYPEPSMFGEIPAYGFFIRHANNVSLSNVVVSYLQEDQRPAFVLNHVQTAEFFNVKARHAANVPVFALENVTDFHTYHCFDVPDTRLEKVDQKKL
ncbi:MAG TPA: glycoside hydrolase family 28 protein [Pyrinomonadaceae bacterium]|jgi:polygalacturonase|nr:glycoside hydrolase family 28 protein [Pyrinomonadaceae bacterium]